jgi:thiol-disulfide isomerase/thioredoxin
MMVRIPVLLAAALALAAAGCRRSPPLTPSATDFGIVAAPGEPAPNFELAGMDGAKVSLAGLRGQVVFVNFWATWCPPCRAEMPSMMALGRELETKYPGKFKMLAVSVDEEGWPAIKKFFGDKAYGGSTAPLVVCLDATDQPTTTAYYCAARGGCPNEYKFPESYIVDRSGRLVAYVVGPRDWSDPRARTYLEQLVQ